MAQLRRELVVKRTLLGQHLRIVRRFVRFIQDQLLACSCSCSCSPKATRYRRITRSPVATHAAVVVDQPPPPPSAITEPPAPVLAAECSDGGDLDVVSIKISLLGDCQIGKTSFMAKYVGDEEEPSGLQMTGLNLMDKMLFVRGARIMFSIWDVGGDQRFLSHVPIACKDAAAILIMFDLTSRRTLTNSMGWYQQARRWNKTGIPILIGTKFDDFVQLPLDLQWTIVTQARAYARAMKATLFFSSATHDINVSKIFKFIAAKFFSSPWTVERNLTLGEPIIDF